MLSTNKTIFRRTDTEITLTRLWSGEENATFRATTTGVVSIDGKQTCYSLEPTAFMVPPGTYPIKLLRSRRFQRMTPHLAVPGRTEIEIHGGNRAEESEGCIMVAEKRLNDYQIYESEPATTAIEQALQAAEANNEVNSIIIS